ncbi:hypothetical protein MMPV_000974 [Pyropia vietnamensis]
MASLPIPWSVLSFPPLAALAPAPQDVALAVGSVAIVAIGLALLAAAARRGLLPRTTARKALHLAAAPAFVATWPAYSAAPGARLAAAAIPTTVAVVLVVAARGGRGAHLASAVSRSGAVAEAAGGPLAYTAVLGALAGRPRWAGGAWDVGGGDGLAEVIGRTWGGGTEWHRIARAVGAARGRGRGRRQAGAVRPWKAAGPHGGGPGGRGSGGGGGRSGKTVLGSVAFVVGSWVATMVGRAWLGHGRGGGSTVAFIGVVCAAVEAVGVVGGLDDNLTVPLVGGLLGWALL